MSAYAPHLFSVFVEETGHRGCDEIVTIQCPLMVSLRRQCNSNFDKSSGIMVQSTELRCTTGKSCKLLLEERSTHDTVDSTVSLGWISGTGIEWLLLPVGGLHTSRSIPSSGLDRPRMLWELLLRDRRRVLQGRGVVAHRTSPARLQRFWPLGKRFQAGIQIFAYPAP